MLCGKNQMECVSTSSAGRDACVTSSEEHPSSRLSPECDGNSPTGCTEKSAVNSIGRTPADVKGLFITIRLAKLASREYLHNSIWSNGLRLLLNFISVTAWPWN